MEGLGDVGGNLEFLSGSGGGKGFFVTQVSHVNKKEKNKCEKNVPGHSGQLRPKHNSPSVLEGVPSGGVVILNIRIPSEKMIIIDGIRIKDNYLRNLPENRDLLRYARENRRAGNMAEIAFWTESFPYDRF